MNFKIRKRKANKIYLAGKVSGLKWEHAYQNFYLAEMANRNRGHIINPMRICKANWSWIRCMIVCIYQLIFKCNRIYLQWNWTESRGAKIEVVVAILTRKEFV
jgi:hypothetical protein